ncbi:MAG: hypothetical protein JXO22_08850, partial [Phycisphaerae bacterium]|nr:hypothetical protein [Phycisphaerae bacterium]
ALLVGRGGFGALTADYRTNSEPPTAMATIHVACTNPDCLADYVTQVPMDFKAWPMKCRQCGQQTVYRAALCHKCRQWYAVRPGQPRECPHCARPPEPAAAPADTKPEEHTDDDEDGW